MFLLYSTFLATSCSSNLKIVRVKPSRTNTNKLFLQDFEYILLIILYRLIYKVIDKTYTQKQL